MGSYYWIKLYNEILSDPKMGRLSDRLWRRTIECFLMAGEHDQDGLLPSVYDMAWKFRTDPEELQEELLQLENEKIVRFNMTHGYWEVINFSKRQAPVSGAERVARHRKREKKRSYYGDDTKGNENGNDPSNAPGNDTLHREDKSREEKSREEIDKEKKVAAAFTYFENNISIITPAVKDQILEWIETYSHEWIMDAMKEAVEHNARHMKYIDAILNAWKDVGRNAKKGKKPIKSGQDYAESMQRYGL